MTGTDLPGLTHVRVPGRSLVIRFARRVWRTGMILWDWMVDTLLYWKHRSAGRSFVDFYATKMDRLAARAPTRATGQPETKHFQLDYLAGHGLTPATVFLDYGCGTAAAGIHIIRFLESAHYVGADISSGVLDVAKRRVEDAALASKQPRFVHLPSGSMAALRGLQFDVIWAQSVLTHMPPDDVEALLRGLKRHMHEGSIFYATFAHVPHGIEQRRIKDWYYAPDAFMRLAAKAGFECHLMTDWRHPAGDVDRLARLSLAK